MNTVDQIMVLASIRRYVDQNMPVGMYIDVMEDIILPSDEGDYADCAAVIKVNTKSQKAQIEELFSGTDVKIAVVCL